MGLSSSSGSLLVLRLNALFTPHAWALRDLGFSVLITGVLYGIHLLWPNSTVWVTDFRCHIAHTLLLRTHQLIPMIDAWPLFGTLARVTCETLAHVARGTQLTWPTITNGQRRPRTGLELLTCSAKRLSLRLWRPTWLYVTGREQCTKMTILFARFNLRTRG